jgi:serine/threonine-protein kinase
MLGVLTLLVAGGAAFGAYKVMGRNEAAPVITSAPVTPPPPVTAAMTATATAAPVIAPAGKTVRVAILPLDAAVEVDGVKATAKDGMVEIVGGLGTVHRVHISKGADQFTDDVAVTQQGAVPAKLELKTTDKKLPKAPPR